MGATLLDLVRGTQRVLPTAIENSEVGDMKILDIKITNMKGVKMKQITATVKSATSNVGYKVRIMFTGLEDPENSIPSTARTNALVRCGCQSFYFWSIAANKKVKALAGGRFKPYVRKTPPPPEGREYKNPQMIPCVCKHIIFLTKVLKNSNVVQ